MRRRLLRAFALALPVVLSAWLSAQSVFVLPAQSGSITPTVFNADPFNQTAVLSGAGFSTTFAFAGPSGKYYLVSNTSNGTIQVTDSTFANLHTAANVVGVLAAAITPDGKRIFEVSSGGILNILDTSTDTLTVNGSFYGGPIGDLAPSLDSTKGYATISNLSGSSVAIFDARTGAGINTIPLGPTANASAISVAPTGLVYVSTQGALLELDPNNYSVRRTIAVTGRPGKVFFTPDGKTGLAVNLTPVNGTAIFEFDMPTRTVRNTVPQSSLPSGITVDRVVPVGNNRALAYSTPSLSLFDVALDTLNVAPYTFASAGGVTALDVSNNLPAGNNLNTSFLFYAVGSTIYRADLNANQITGQLSLGGSAGAMSFAAPGVTNGTPATLLTFGDNQSIAPNVTSAPLVLKAIDATGHPLAGVQVNFSSAGPGVVFSNANVVTDNFGNATTTVAAATTQVVTVNVTAGGLTTAFTVNVGTAGGGGGGGGGSANGGLFIVGGQGGIITENQRTDAADGTSMVVQLNDATGAPIQGANVLFTFQSGSGTVVDNQGGDIGVTSTLTEVTNTCTAGQKNCAPGQASVDFLASVVPTFPPAFTQASVTATAPDGTTVTFYITTVPFNVLFQAQIEVHKPVFGSTLTAQAGSTVKGAIQGVISSGTASPMPNIGLALQNVDPTQPAPATCVGGFPLSDGSGAISCDLVATAAPGNYQFFVVIGGTRSIGPFNLKITPGVPTTAKIVSGDAQTGNPGTRLTQPLMIQVTDAAGNTSANVPVTWTVSPSGAATLSNVSNTTDSNGNASAIVSFSASASGSVKVTAQAGNLTALTFNLTATVPTAGIQLVSGGGQSVGTGSQFANPVVVKVVNASGTGLAGIPVSFSASNGASVGNSSVNTDANGLASVAVTAGTNAGAIIVTAQTGGFSVTATLTAIPPGPSNLVFLNGASFLSGISAGAIVAIQGNGLLPGSITGIFSAQSVLGPLPTTFEGITVTFNGFASPIFSVANANGIQQVVVQVPYEIGNASSVTVVITTQGGGSTTVTNVAVQPYAPGIFETTLFGPKQAVAVHAADGSYVTPSGPARRGENIIIYLTGLGQTNPATGTNRAGAAGQNVIAPMVAGINLAGTTVVSTQLVPGLIGVYALTLTIPPNAPTGLINIGAIAYDSANNPYFAQGSAIPIQ